MKQQPKRTWHTAQVNGAWRVYDPEQRQHGGRFNTAEAAQRYMEHEIAWLKSRPAERYGEAQLNDYLESYADYQEYCFAMLRLGEAPETFVKWYNGANQANNPYVTQPQAVQP